MNCSFNSQRTQRTLSVAFTLALAVSSGPTGVGLLGLSGRRQFGVLHGRHCQLQLVHV